MRYVIIILLISFSHSTSFSQNKTTYWCFGDSSGISFVNVTNPTTFRSATTARGSACTISDSLGNLLFYAASANKDYYQIPNNFNLGCIYNKSHQVMDNGDLLFSTLAYHELQIIPYPGSSSLYYVFSTSETIAPFHGIYYSIVDISMNNGYGKVITKNQLLFNSKIADCLTAIPHGNGRDWWVFARTFGNSSNEFYRWLVTPSGISGPFIQNIGTPSSAGLYFISLNKENTKMAVCSLLGLVETFDLDRCSGLLSNWQNYKLEDLNNPPLFFGIELSPNSNYLYLSVSDINTMILQQDLNNLTFSPDTIWNDSLGPDYSGGFIQRAPNEKLYYSRAWNDGLTYNYPYPDTAYNIYNTTIGVINQPDSAGIKCDFQPHSFPLGGSRTYWGLPNNPEYNLGKATGSPCDTLVSIHENVISSPEITAYYNNFNSQLIINGYNLKGGSYTLDIVSIQGKIIFSESGNLSANYYTKTVELKNISTGLYLIHFKTSKSTLTQKIIIQ